MLTIEDLTGNIKVLINKNNRDLYNLAEKISLDCILGFKGSGNKEIIFIDNIIFPDSSLNKQKNSPNEEFALFLGDLHFGSKLFLKENFENFVEYLSSDNDEVSKIKYLFLVGDIVAGIGNYPGQENDLIISKLEDQFSELSKILKKVPANIKIIISPGNHDGVRLMEPQPIFDKKYAHNLYSLDNVSIIENPSTVNIAKSDGFEGFDVLTYHGFSYPYYASNISHLIKDKAMNNPTKIMHYLLKCRHLAPTHGSSQYLPSENDFYFIEKIPDIFVSGHIHKSEINYYNNILTISVSCWEDMSSYQEKMGIKPDKCMVPMVNLKTREFKVLDFNGGEDAK